jgi:pimeloyl-ACP methyl ester carboxylesterase
MLKKVIGCDNPNRQMDVVFVHGLNGNWRYTWQGSKDPQVFWPRWLGEDLPDIGVWSFDYEVKISKWTGEAMPIVRQAVNFLAHLTLDLGTRPLLFVTHSMGGLIVKQALNRAYVMKELDWEPLRQSTKGIVFLATPHSGSELASSNWLKYLGSMIQPNEPVKELKANDPNLLVLNDWFRNNFEDLNVQIQVYCEERPTKIGPLSLMVVDQSTANPGIAKVPVIPIPADHASICKPTDREDLVYRRTRQFVENCLRDPFQPL